MLLNTDWLSSRVCRRKVEIFKLEQHLSRRKIHVNAPAAQHARARQRARACCVFKLRCKLNLAAPQIKSCCRFSQQQVVRQQTRYASLHSL
jgi:hypothetical protein